jgi:hypothetical protein
MYIYIFPWYSHGIWVNDIKSLLGMNYMYYIKVNLNRMNGNIFFLNGYINEFGGVNG